MADYVRIEMDEAALVSAIARLGPALETRLKAAAHTTANNIAREARARVARATGRLASSIQVHETPHGYIVGTFLEPTVGISWHTMRRSGRSHTQAVTQDNLPIWIERGTRKRKPGSHASPPRPFFDVSIRLEEAPHQRRVQEAMQDAIDEMGLGS